MKKTILVCLCLIVLILIGCSIRKTGSTSKPNNNKHETNDIDTTQKNELKEPFFNLDFLELQCKVEQQINAVDNQIKMPFTSTPGVEIFFSRDGRISQAFFYLQGVTKASVSEWITTHYVLQSDPEAGTAESDFDVRTYHENLHLIKGGSQREEDQLKYFNNFMRWADSFDFESLLKDQPEPAVYELLAGQQLPYELLSDETVTRTLLDVSSGIPVKITKDDIPFVGSDFLSEYDNKWFDPYYNAPYNENSELREIIYYVILAYYPAENTDGWTPEQVLWDAGSYLSEDEPGWNQHYKDVLGTGEYRVNNILILFPDGV